MSLLGKVKRRAISALTVMGLATASLTAPAAATDIEEQSSFAGTIETSFQLSDGTPVGGGLFTISYPESGLIPRFFQDDSYDDLDPRLGFIKINVDEEGEYLLVGSAPEGYEFEDVIDRSRRVTLYETRPNVALRPWVVKPLPVEGTVTAYIEVAGGAPVEGGSITVRGPLGSVSIEDGSLDDLHAGDGVIRVQVTGAGKHTVTLTGVPAGFKHEPIELTAFISADEPHANLDAAFIVEHDVTVVNTLAPQISNNTITIPTIEGIEYLIDNKVVTGTIDITGDTTVTAQAATGYTLAADADTSWTFTYVAPIPTGNVFFISNSWTSTTHDVAISYGRIGDEVLVGDWDGDGNDTFAVRRGNTFYINNSLIGGIAEIQLNYGRSTDKVFIGDWDGDGRDSPAVNRIVR